MKRISKNKNKNNKLNNNYNNKKKKDKILFKLKYLKMLINYKTKKISKKIINKNKIQTKFIKLKIRNNLNCNKICNQKKNMMMIMNKQKLKKNQSYYTEKLILTSNK